MVKLAISSIWIVNVAGEFSMLEMPICDHGDSVLGALVFLYSCLLEITQRRTPVVTSQKNVT